MPKSEKKDAELLLAWFKQREDGGKCVFDNGKLKITTYGRESKTLKHLKKTKSAYIERN